MWLCLVGIIKAKAGLLLAKVRTFFAKQGVGGPVNYLFLTLSAKSRGHSQFAGQLDAVIHLKSGQFVLLYPAKYGGAGSP